jgi:hypothetical protein
VEVRRIVIIEEHPYGNPKEPAYLRHGQTSGATPGRCLPGACR